MIQPSNFFVRLVKLSISRIFESKYSVYFAVLITITTLVCIILEGLIVDAHLKVYSELQSLSPDKITSSLALDGGSVDPNDPLLQIRRLKNENVFFILFSLFQFVLGFDAVVRQSVIQLIAHTVNQLILVIFSGIQIAGTVEKNVNYVDNEPEITVNFKTALRVEIGLVSTLVFLFFFFLFLCYKLYKQLGWKIYKRIGADLDQQSRYQTVHLFFLNLKLDAFFHFVLFVFYFVVMTQSGYYSVAITGSGLKLIAYVIHLVLTVLLIPALFLARFGVMTENRRVMISFQVVQGILGVDFVLMLIDSANGWAFWILAVCIAICLSVASIVIATLVTRNFDKGLKPCLQRLSEKENALHSELADGKRDKLKVEDWLIDDDEDYDYDNNSSGINNNNNYSNSISNNSNINNSSETNLNNNNESNINNNTNTAVNTNYDKPNSA